MVEEVRLILCRLVRRGILGWSLWIVILREGCWNIFSRTLTLFIILFVIVSKVNQVVFFTEGMYYKHFHTDAGERGAVFESCALHPSVTRYLWLFPSPLKIAVGAVVLRRLARSSWCFGWASTEAYIILSWHCSHWDSSFIVRFLFLGSSHVSPTFSNLNLQFWFITYGPNFVLYPFP